MKIRYLAALLVFLTQPTFANGQTNILIATGAWPPFTNKDGSGIYFDIANEIYGPQGIRLQIEFVPYKRALKLLETQRADAMFGTYSQEQENKHYLITPTHAIDAEETAGIFKKDHTVKGKGLDSILNQRVAWIRGFDYHEVIPFKTVITEVDSIEQGTNMLAHDRIDMFMHPKIGLLKALKTSPKLSPYAYQVETILKEKLYMAFSNNARGQALAAIYDQQFPKLLASGKIEEIFAKYDWTVHYPFAAQQDSDDHP